jgi:hypothetical protein
MGFEAKQKSYLLHIFPGGFELTKLTFYGIVNETGGNKILLDGQGINEK